MRQPAHLRSAARWRYLQNSVDAAEVQRQGSQEAHAPPAPPSVEILIRSLTRSRCGEVYRPVLIPAALLMKRAWMPWSPCHWMPAISTEAKRCCGSPSALSRARMWSSETSCAHHSPLHQPRGLCAAPVPGPPTVPMLLRTSSHLSVSHFRQRGLHRRGYADPARLAAQQQTILAPRQIARRHRNAIQILHHPQPQPIQLLCQLLGVKKS